MNTVTQGIQIMLFYTFRMFPIRPNKIVINSYMGRGYGGEGKAIADQLLKQKKNYDIVWLCNDIRESAPKGIRYVKEKSIRSIYELVTAKIWIDNRRKSGCVRKRKSQFYIQTWHGDVCIKYVEGDAGDGLSQEYIRTAKRDSKMADLFVAGSEWREKNYKKAFWYNGEILKGDLYKQFSSQENRGKNRRIVWESLSLPEGARYALYAPTFRNDHNLEVYSLDYERLVHALEARFGGRWCAVVRLHPNISNLHDRIEYDQTTVFDGSKYEQVNDLIENCDLLISDFSGVIFDGFKAKKRVVLFATDFEKYISEERGLYFDFKQMPSPISQNNEQLEKIISHFDDSAYEESRQAFVDKLGYYTADAAKLVADRIQSIVQGGA